jgi:hypothetical protein
MARTRPRRHPDEGAAPEVNPEAELIGEAALAYLHENDLYPDIKATLETFWAKERQIEPLAVEITAAQGRKATGGRWTRPDLVSVAVRTYRYLPLSQDARPHRASAALGTITSVDTREPPFGARRAVVIGLAGSVAWRRGVSYVGPWCRAVQPGAAADCVTGELGAVDVRTNSSEPDGSLPLRRL